MYGELVGRLAHGATVITPNRRLSAAIRRDFDQRAFQSGSRTWPAADVIPWRTWLERSFREAFVRGAVERVLMSATQARVLWQRIIGDAPESAGLLQIRSTADAALEAWDIVHAWRLLSALQGRPVPDETHAFLRWAQAYDRVCTRERLTDHARLPDLVADLATSRAIPTPPELILFGFDRLTPQHEALLETLRKLGTCIGSASADTEEAAAVVVSYPGVAEEVQGAALWARACLSADPAARIGIVVPDLTRLRPAVARALDEVLTPEAYLHPGRVIPRPWNISLGLALSRWPLVHSALLLLELAASSLTMQRTSVLLRSPFLGGAESERNARALLDARLRRFGEPRLTLRQLLHYAGEEGHLHTCGLLAQRLRAVGHRMEELPAGTQPMSFWGPALQALLAAAQWPGERELNSEEYQTFAKWKELMAGLAQLDLVSRPVTLRGAVAVLQALAADELFQPETPEVPIQVLGILESSGIEFDHLLVLGLTDEAWPRLPRPNALLPIELQRARGVPAASADTELAFARQLQQGWRRAAQETVFSYHRAEGDAALGCSPLLRGLPAAAASTAGVDDDGGWRERLFTGADLETIADWQGQPLPENVAFGGGARLIQDQAACPFRAFAAHRLGARSLPHPVEGLDARDRGVLVHNALAALWTELRSADGLAQREPDVLLALIHRSVEQALRRLMPRRISAFQERFLELEHERLTNLLLDWLEFESRRGTFEVLASEEARDVTVGGIQLKLRLDRVDLLPGGEMLIDYKTGQTSVRAWEGERPDEPQLLLYSFARAEPPQAIALAHVRRGECGFDGLAAEAGVADGIKAIETGHGDWAEVLEQWRATVERLAVAFRSGVAPVDPKKGPETCRNCDLQSLCRVSELADRNAPAVEETAE